MKGLNKILLVAAIAAAPLAANAQLKPLSNTAMGNLTGQAGISIELQTKVDIGSVVYTDTAGTAATDIGGGSLVIKGVHIGSGAVTAAATSGGTQSVASSLNNLLATVDLASDGSAVIHVSSTNGAPIDYTVAVDQVNLQDSTGAAQAVIAQNINVTGQLFALDLRVVNSATGAFTIADPLGGTPLLSATAGQYTSDTLIAAVAFDVTSMNMDIPLLAVGIRNLTIHGAGFNNAPTTSLPYATAVLALSASTPAATGATATSALDVAVSAFNADINIGSILIGGVSIGSLAINNLSVTNTDLKIYGH